MASCTSLILEWLYIIFAVTTEYFHEIHNNRNSEQRQHFDSTFRLYLVIIRNNYVTSASAYICAFRAIKN